MSRLLIDTLLMMVSSSKRELESLFCTRRIRSDSIDRKCFLNIRYMTHSQTNPRALRYKTHKFALFQSCTSVVFMSSGRDCRHEYSRLSSSLTADSGDMDAKVCQNFEAIMAVSFRSKPQFQEGGTYQLKGVYSHRSETFSVSL